MKENKKYNKTANLAIKFNIILRILLIFFIVGYSFSFITYGIPKAKYIKTVEETVFRSDEELISLSSKAKDREVQQALFRAKVYQEAYEMKYGKKLGYGDVNSFNNAEFSYKTKIATMILVILLLIVSFLLLMSLSNIWINFKEYEDGKLDTALYKKKWKRGMFKSILVTILLLVPLIGLAIPLMIPNFILLAKTKA